MAKIVEYKEIPLDDLVIGKGQVRTQDVGKGIDDLAESIKRQGLLQPIMVCEARDSSKWEILTGQRRFLAHKMLKMDSITAAVLDERVEEYQAKAISITENLIRRQLSGKELTDGIVHLYNLYGNAKTVAETTGLPYQQVLKYVKYPRLLPKLRDMVDRGQININGALKAQDSATEGYEDPDPELAITLAREMAEMTGVQQKKLVEEHRERPDKPIEELIEYARTGARVVQIVATVTQSTHAAIQRFASEEGTNQDEAAATLIEEALVGRGLLED